MIVQQCINCTCKNTFYVKKYQIGLCLECKTCIEKRNKKYESNIDI